MRKPFLVRTRSLEPMCESDSNPRGRIFHLIKGMSIFKHISFGGQPLSRSQLVKILPEAGPFLLHFEKTDLAYWEYKMQSNNEILRRGIWLANSWERKCMIAKVKTLQFSSLDTYILHLHAGSVAEILDSCATFAERVLPLSRSDPHAKAWQLGEQLYIHSRHWRALTRTVLRLVDLIGCMRHASSIQNGTHASDEGDEWPNERLLQQALRRAAQCYAHKMDPTPSPRPPLPYPATNVGEKEEKNDEGATGEACAAAAGLCRR